VSLRRPRLRLIQPFNDDGPQEALVFGIEVIVKGYFPNFVEIPNLSGLSGQEVANLVHGQAIAHGLGGRRMTSRVRRYRCSRTVRGRLGAP